MRKLLGNQRGQGMVEYALILALVSVVAIVTLQALSPQITKAFQSVVNALTKANN